MLILALLFQQAVVQPPQRTGIKPGVIATDQRISPAGAQSVFTSRVMGLRFGKNASELWVAVSGSVWRLAWTDNSVLARVPFVGTPGVYGLALDTVAGRVLLSSVGRAAPDVARGPGMPTRATGLAQLSAIANDSLRVFGAFGTDIAGSPAIAATRNASGHRVVVVPLPANNRLLVVDADDGSFLSNVPLGVIPVAAVVAADGAFAWVSELGGKQPGPGDMSARQCCDPQAEPVRTDARGIAKPGAVVKVNLIDGSIGARITVGLHPTGMAWDRAHDKLYVADGNSDDVTVVDTKGDTLLGAIAIAPFSQRLAGLAPTAVALTPRGENLFVALGGVNAVAVVNVATRGSLGVVRGLIPTSWYPSTLDVSADGRFLAVGSLLGVGSGPGTVSGRTASYVHSVRGAVNVIELPTQAQLDAFTTAVAANNRLTLAGGMARDTAIRTNVAARAVPERPGEPSLIRHVVYIIKENRTYDQVFGDLGRGDGDTSLVMYGRNVTPNQHALAEQFVTLDRFFASGANSADGHQWLTQANETEYTLWPLYTGRSYPSSGEDPLAYSSGGFIWESAASRGKSVAVFGEYAPEPPDSGAPLRARQIAEYRDRQAGQGTAPLPTYNTTSDIPSLDKVLVRDFPGWTMGLPDVVRAEIFAKYLKQWEQRGDMPNLVIVQLPSNHTSGTTAGWCTPAACVADNDLALGQMVESITHSSFWPSTAILVVEDDAQNGVDHVDGHRTVALAISPYTRRGVVDSTFYNQVSMVKTIELMLGLPAMSMFDLAATDMTASFVEPGVAPTLTPFTAITPVQSIYDVNPPAARRTGQQRLDALASARMRFDVPDAAPTDRLNQILWRAAKPGRKFPGVRQALFFPMSLDIADEDRDEVKPAAKRKPPKPNP